MARQTVPFTKSRIAKLPDEHSAIYIIKTDGGRNNYTGVAKRGRVQERLTEHLATGPDPVPGSKVSIRQAPSIKATNATNASEKAIISRSYPKYNIRGKQR